MNTFILKWNPVISSYGMDRFEEDFDFGKDKVLENYSPWDFNWSVWEHEKAHEGDRFFMLRVGEGENNGIVMSGTFTSDPYEGEDWSGKGRKTFYMDMEFDLVADPTSDRVLPTKLLTELLPNIEWTKGHSGMWIEPQAALTLEKAWYDHLKGDLTPYGKAMEIARIAHFGQKDRAGEDYLKHVVRVAARLFDQDDVVGLLHDVVEASEFTLEDLAKEGFSQEVIKALEALTHKDGESYEDFIHRVGQNKIARAVKMADLRDNMDLLRLPELKDEDWERAKKYHKAYKYLQGKGERGL